MLFMRSPRSSESAKTELVEVKTESVPPHHSKQNTVWKDIGKKVIAVFHCMVRHHMPLLIILFINNGYAQVIISTGGTPNSLREAGRTGDGSLLGGGGRSLAGIDQRR